MPMLKEPDFDYPQTDGECYVYEKNGQYHAYLDLDAAIGLLYSLYWLARDQIVGEEVSILSGQRNDMRQRGKSIGYCEFNLIPTHWQKKQGKHILKETRPVRHTPH